MFVMSTQRLRPVLEDLIRQEVLVQAWKKTVSHIRSHNWYADTLELDVSALRLPEFIAEIQNDLSTPNEWTPHALKMVPAPKSQEWAIKGDKWRPVKGNPKAARNLRPLAHLSLRDQVVSTAVMLCLADAVETAQGDPQLDVRDQQNCKSVVSYGNRLFCDTDGTRLLHRWGSSKLYRSYFQDYRTFLLRPEIVAATHKAGNENARVAVFQGDLKRFYDRVRPAMLHQTLKGFCPSPECAPFLDLLQQMMNWSWADGEDADMAATYAERGNILGFDEIALPQGLVAAGFLSNAVLAGFDGVLKSRIGSPIADGLILLDASRYVDDIRLVLQVDGDDPGEGVIQHATEWLNIALGSTADGLILNTDKTTLGFFGESRRTLIPQSARMARIQRAVSGGFDAAGGMEVLAEIESLFRAQDQFGEERTEVRVDWPFMVVPDVRDETVARFGAGRFRSTFRSLRPLLEEVGPPSLLPKDDDDPVLPTLVLSKQQLDDNARAFSVGLIERWLRDPSHVRLLRIALDIYPDAAFAEYVLDLLWQFIGQSGGRKESRRVALYCLAELFRAGATETGLVEDEECLPSGCDVKQYRSCLLDHATKIVNYATAHPRSLPWYLTQQVLLFISTEWPEQQALPKLPKHSALSLYNRFLGFLFEASATDEWNALFAALARRSYRPSTMPKLVLDNLKSSGEFDKLVEIDVGAAEAIRSGARSRFRRISSLSSRRMGQSSGIRRSNIHDGFESLGASAKGKSPNLRSERGILQLSVWWLEQIESDPTLVPSGYFPGDILIDASPSATEKLGFRLSPRSYDAIPVALPSFIENDQAWRWSLSNLLLFALRGSASSVPLKSMQGLRAAGYRPTASEWVAQFFGGYYGRDRMGDPSLPSTTWLEGFLLRLVSWPGLSRESAEAQPSVIQISEALAICRDRLQTLEAETGESSGTLEPVPN
jgi:hypothetical protein